MSEFIGPSLPPGLGNTSEDNEGGNDDGDQGSIGPVLPINQDKEEEEEDEGSSSITIGPQIPPSLVVASSSKSSEQVAPVVAEERHQVADTTTMAGVCSGAAGASYGPALPPTFDDPSGSDGSDDGEVIGPLPVRDVEDLNSLKRVRSEIEARSKSMRDKLTGKSTDPEGPQREEWMTELPPGVKPLGLGPRKFRSSAQELGDRSVWTDTPADRVRKAQETLKQQEKAKRQGEEHNFLSERDKLLERQVAEHNEKFRGQSLVELHRKRKAEEAGGATGPQERRPFDRERDLALPKTLITPAKRRALEKDSAKSLQSKFSRGTNAFL